MSEGTSFDQWAIVDVMGHQRFIGRVTEQVIAGTGFIRVDIPETSCQPGWSKLLGTSSIYSITPVSERIARHLAEQRGERPVKAYELPGIESSTVEDEFDDDEPYDQPAAGFLQFDGIDHAV